MPFTANRETALLPEMHWEGKSLNTWTEFLMISALAVIWIFVTPKEGPEWGKHLIIFIIGAGWLIGTNKLIEERRAKRDAKRLAVAKSAAAGGKIDPGAS